MLVFAVIHWARPLRGAALSSLLVLAAPLLWATGAPPLPLSLREAQQLAVRHSRQVQAQDALVRSARDMAVSAGQLPDPVLKLGVDNLPLSGPAQFSFTQDFMTMRRIGLMQELPRAEKRQLKAERFERDAERAQAQRQQALAGIQRDTALAWLERYYALAVRTQLQQQQEETRLQEQGALIAFREGKGAQADVFAARTALIEIEDRLSQVDSQARNADLMLMRWTGTQANRPLSGTPDWQNTVLESRLSTDELRQHPPLAVLAAQVDAAGTELRLAQANTKPDWALEATYLQRGPAYANMVSIGVSIPLQWDRKNRQHRDIAARLAQVDEARANHEDALQSYEADVRTLLNDWQTSKERARRYSQQMVPVAGQRSAAALSSYRVGKGELASVLAARQAEINTRLQALELERETARLWARLNHLRPDPAIDDSAAVNTPVPAKGQP